jgi:integrase
MSVKIRPYRQGGGWEVDILFRLPNGRRYRERSKAPVNSKSGALRWGQDRERHLVEHGPEPTKREVPTLEEYAPRFMDEYARANRQKASGIAAKDTILKVHLVPHLGLTRLDAIANEDIQRLKHRLTKRAPKTVNNVLTVLNTVLRTALEWGVIERVPCTIRLLKVPKTSMGFYEFEDFERLVEAARLAGPVPHLIALLGGEAGLRSGEMIALEWADIDLGKRQLCVERSDWHGQVNTTKGGRLRYVPLTTRLTTALRGHRHLKGQRVLSQPDGSPLKVDMVGDHVRRAARKAGVTVSGAHRLRHTFCSHLAMRGAATRAIQELAGHQDLRTTQRYMHLSPAALDEAIRLLDSPRVSVGRGEMLETDVLQSEKAIG